MKKELKMMNDISKHFLDELKTLLKKYDAELQLEETYRGYDGSLYEMTVWAYTKYDAADNKIRDEINLNLGTYLNGKD